MKDIGEEEHAREEAHAHEEVLQAQQEALALDRAQEVAARVHESAESPPPVLYEGLITRTIAFAVDAAIIDLIGLVVGGAVGLALSILNLPQNVRTVAIAIGGVAFIIWTVAYFVVFWSTTGQTPGNRLLRIRVCRAEDGRVLRPRKALLRFGALILACIPFFAGLAPILIDDRRRGMHDMLAGTVVLAAEPV